MDQNYIQNLCMKSYEDYIRAFEALSNPIRIKILGVLLGKRIYVSELARVLNISRPLLYLHLKKLEAARLIEGEMEISNDGKATKYYSVTDFFFKIDPNLIRELSEHIVIDLQGGK